MKIKYYSDTQIQTDANTAILFYSTWSFMFAGGRTLPGYPPPTIPAPAHFLSAFPGIMERPHPHSGGDRPTKKRRRNRGGKPKGDRPPPAPGTGFTDASNATLTMPPPAPSASDFVRPPGAVSKPKGDFMTSERFADLPIAAETKRGIAEALG